MYLTGKESRARIREAQNARNNRAEIVKALSSGQITRRDLFRWGLFTATGALALKNGLSPYARSAYGAVPTGTPATPLFGARPFTQPFQRLNFQTPVPLTPLLGSSGQVGPNSQVAFTGVHANEPVGKRLSWHTEFNDSGGTAYRNPLGRGPMEGRPPGEHFAHQRWEKALPKVGHVMAMSPVEADTKFHPLMMAQAPNSVWCYASGRNGQGYLPGPLLKARYGEPILMRIYNKLPVNRADNNGFGRNEITTHLHNAHNGATSDGACNAHYFPGQFYDYHWSMTLARADMPAYQGGRDRRASGPDDAGVGGAQLNKVPGDFRENQGTLWFHDHRFFFTAENVYKGNAGMINFYSGPDRGNEEIEDGINLRLPSGNQLPWGNVDFDVNLLVSDFATDPDGQLFFDIFDTDGFLGDRLLVNHTYTPVMEVLPRKYRFRILNASMARFIQLALVNAGGGTVPFKFIANDGNFVVNPISMSMLDMQGPAERYDIVVDFSTFRVGDNVKLVNLLKQTDGRKPDKTMSVSDALRGVAEDTTVGPIMMLKIVDRVRSVDNSNKIHYASTLDKSRVPTVLTEQIPIVAPVRERVIEWGRSGSGDSRDNPGGVCIPECGDFQQSFPWTVKINGQSAHSLNANRVSLLIPKPGEVEHWTYINGGGGWDHPIHLHFEEGVTMNRGGAFIGPHERNVRKDVWRLRPGGTVKFQVRFGEFGGAYVNHCHNTVHEDWAMLIRYDVLRDGQPTVTPTPIPTPDGVTYKTPEILPEGDPRTSIASQ